MGCANGAYLTGRRKAGAYFMGTLLLALLLPTIVAQRAVADTGSIQYTLGSPLTSSESKYELFFTVPDEIQTGKPANLTVFLYCTELSGWKVQGTRQFLQLTLIFGTNMSIRLPELENTVPMYEGNRWGPLNVTVNLSDAQVGIARGQKTTATMYAQLIVYEKYTDPAFPVISNDGYSLKLTQLTVKSGTPLPAATQDGRFISSLVVGGAVILILTGLALSARLLTVGRQRRN